MIPAQYISRELVASNTYCFYFKPLQPLHYIAGQFTELLLPHDNADDRGERRWFTISSAPHEEYVAITARVPATDSSSFKKELMGLQAGDSVTLALPMGDFVLPKDVRIPLLFVAAGIGSTPFRSMLADMFHRKEQRDVTMLHAVRTSEEIAFPDFFADLGAKHKIVLSEPPADWSGHAGHLTSDFVLQHIDANHYVYIAGPEELVEVLDTQLKEKGVSRRHIFSDYFPGYV